MNWKKRAFRNRVLATLKYYLVDTGGIEYG